MSYERIKISAEFLIREFNRSRIDTIALDMLIKILLEHFNDNYRPEIIDFSLSLMEVSEDEESV